ncbi:MAG: M14 family metallopeptidase [Bacteroidia bacterium]|nr:M14 family metallopeptidase [Bacteroidia bacterium]
MKRLLLFHVLLALILAGCSKSDKNKVPSEALLHLKFDQNLSSTYSEVIANYQKLDSAWPEAKLLECGPTDCGKPLHLFVINSDRVFDPAKIRKSGKRIVLINNGIHSGEPEGIEGSMLAADDILRNLDGMRKYLENTVICIIPVYNVDGLLYQNRWHRTNQPGPVNPGYRGNNKNLDLNRDFVKLETANARSFVKIFREWDPDVFLDTHTTNGSDHQYVITYLPAQHNSMPEPMGDFFSETMIPALFEKMRSTPYEMIPYAEWDNESPEKGIANYVQTPRFSTGYALLFHSFSQMIENHCYKPYPARVKSIYIFILKLIEFTRENGDRMGRLRIESKERTRSQKEFALKYEIDSTKFKMVEFKGYRMGFDKSPLTGDDREIYDYNKPFTIEGVPVYDDYKPSLTVKAPVYYLVPQAWSEVIERLKINGIEMKRLPKDTAITVEVYYIDSLVWATEHENGHSFHNRFTTRKEVQTIQYYAGDYLVPVNQDANYFIVNQLEPEGPDSYFRWNFFDPCLEDREWFSPHPVLEDRIAQYLNETPDSRKMLDDAIVANPKMAHDRAAQMYFVYTRCGLGNKWFNRYPVARVMENIQR